MKKKNPSLNNHIDYALIEQYHKKREQELEHVWKSEEEGEQLGREQMANATAGALLWSSLPRFLSAYGADGNADEIKKRLSEFESAGADINRIKQAIIMPSELWNATKGIVDMRSDFGSTKDKIEREFKKTIELLDSIETFPPVLTSTSRGRSASKKVLEMQAKLKDTLKQYEQDRQDYFDLKRAVPFLNKIIDGLSESDANAVLHAFPPRRIAYLSRKGQKPAKYSTHNLWGQSLIAIVSELTGCGYIQQQAYLAADDLLNLVYPHNYRDPATRSKTERAARVKSLIRYHSTPNAKKIAKR